MRLLLYNIRYGIGSGSSMRWPLPGVAYLMGNRENLERITAFIKAQDPDIVGLVEVDSGSIRTRKVNQAETIARALGHYSVYQSKYGASSLNHMVPIVRKQGNAFLAAPRVHGELDLGGQGSAEEHGVHVPRQPDQEDDDGGDRAVGGAQLHDLFDVEAQRPRGEDAEPGRDEASPKRVAIRRGPA